MTGLSCCICSSPLGESIYESAGEMSITSLARTYPGKTQVYFCDACEHVQTSELPDIDDYYDKAYNILAESEEEDHIYEYDGDKPVYRNDHQLNLLTAKTRLPEGGRVIDYGCGKGATLRGLLERRPDIDGHLFDVSDNYLNYWKSLVDEGKWATYSTPEAWEGTFDTVVSMFALEHVARPADMLSTVRKLLKQDGQFFFIVPNFLTNISDMIVVDHVNHVSVQQGRFSENL